FLHPLSFLLHPRPPTFTLFPYTTLFRSPPNARPGSSARPARCRRRPSPAPSRRRPWCFPARRPTRRGGRTPSSSAISSRLLFAVDRKSTRLNSSHVKISYAVFCLKKKIL